MQIGCEILRCPKSMSVSTVRPDAVLGAFCQGRGARAFGIRKACGIGSFRSFQMSEQRGIVWAAVRLLGVMVLSSLPTTVSRAAEQEAVGPQYDSTHVYVPPSDLDAFVGSLVATFGGEPSKPSVTNVLPVPSSTVLQFLLTPVGTFSVFAFQTPIPFPFGEERTGYLVTDMNQALKAARSAGAEVIVEPFKDPIGIDAVIQWPGGLKMQLYWHFTPPKYAPLEMIPDNRFYLSRERADEFVDGFVRFAHGEVVADDPHADA